jgi:osmotically-inducible protein OsmY
MKTEPPSLRRPARSHLPVPFACERGRTPETEKHDYPATRQLHSPTAARAADRVVQVSPSDAVSRRTASGPSMAVEIARWRVYLNGVVGEGLQRETAESTTRNTPGVTKLVDNIGVSR